MRTVDYIHVYVHDGRRRTRDDWSPEARAAAAKARQHPHSGSFTSGQARAHKVLTEEGHSHKGRDHENVHHYQHPRSGERTSVYPDGTANVFASMGRGQNYTRSF
jgi:hypothetical protein